MLFPLEFFGGTYTKIELQNSSVQNVPIALISFEMILK